MALIYICFAWLLGILTQYYFSPHLPWAIFAGLSIGIALVLRLFHRPRLAFLLLLIIIYAFGAARFSSNQAQSDGLVALQDDSIVRLDGVVITEPDKRDTVNMIRLRVRWVYWLGDWHEIPGTVLLRLPIDIDVQYGDRLVATGELLPPPIIDNFDYNAYLARQGIYSQMTPSRVERISRGNGVWWRATLIHLKQNAEKQILSALPEPEASLLVGILLGDDKGLAPEVREAFNNTSTSHIIAISGFNMTIIAAIVSTVLGYFIESKWRIFAFSVVVITLYTLFVGANAAIVRASIMSLILVYGQNMRRKAYIPTSLAAVVILMSLYDPWLLWDIGFQLSVAAVLGIMLLVPIGQRQLNRFFPPKEESNLSSDISRILSEVVVVSGAAQLFVLPLILFYFGRLPLLSPLANLLIVPAQAGVLLIGGSATLLALIFPAVAGLLFDAVWLPLAWTTTIIRQLAAHPLVSTELPISSWLLGALVLFGLGAIHLQATAPHRFERLIRSWRFWGRAIVIVISLALGSVLVQRIIEKPDDELHVVYLDAGLSNSVIIETPRGAVFLIDGGRYPSRLLTALGDQLSPQQRHIDILFITSDEYDDIGALPEVAERYTILTLITAIESSREPAYYDLLDQLEAGGTVIIHATEAGRILSEDGVELDILAPQPDIDKGDSLVLRMRYGEAIFLFTHNLSAYQEQLLLSEPHRIQATVLQVADHGKSNSNNARWLAGVNPQVTVLQNDPSHYDAEVASQVLARLEERNLWRTDYQGTIVISTDGKQLNIRPSQMQD